MRILLLGSLGSWHSGQLQTAAAGRGHECLPVPFESLAAQALPAGVNVSSSAGVIQREDAVLVRMMPAGSLEQVVSRMNFLQVLHRQGTVVVNPPAAVECAVDKGLTTMRLGEACLPTPRTFLCQSAQAAQDAFSALGGDVVIKPLFGSEGRGIVRVSDVDICQRVCGALERIGAVIYMQEFIAHGGWDLRLLVLGNEVLGAIRRSHPRDFRTNVARDGAASPHSPRPEEIQAALAAAAAVGACFAGVDLMYDPHGRLLVIEVNAVPGWKALQAATNVPVASRLIEFVEGLKK